MHLQSKSEFIHHCYDMFLMGDSIPDIVDGIEQLMEDYHLAYLRENQATLLTHHEGRKETRTARDEFEKDLDDFGYTKHNVQRMKVLLNNYIKFDEARWYKPKAPVTVEEYETSYQ